MSPGKGVELCGSDSGPQRAWEVGISKHQLTQLLCGLPIPRFTGAKLETLVLYFLATMPSSAIFGPGQDSALTIHRVIGPVEVNSVTRTFTLEIQPAQSEYGWDAPHVYFI